MMQHAGCVHRLCQGTGSKRSEGKLGEGGNGYIKPTFEQSLDVAGEGVLDTLECRLNLTRTHREVEWKWASGGTASRALRKGFLADAAAATATVLIGAASHAGHCVELLEMEASGNVCRSFVQQDGVPPPKIKPCNARNTATRTRMCRAQGDARQPDDTGGGTKQGCAVGLPSTVCKLPLVVCGGVKSQTQAQNILSLFILEIMNIFIISMGSKISNVVYTRTTESRARVARTRSCWSEQSLSLSLSRDVHSQTRF